MSAASSPRVAVHFKLTEAPVRVQCHLATYRPGESKARLLGIFYSLVTDWRRENWTLILPPATAGARTRKYSSFPETIVRAHLEAEADPLAAVVVGVELEALWSEVLERLHTHISWERIDPQSWLPDEREQEMVRELSRSLLSL